MPIRLPVRLIGSAPIIWDVTFLFVCCTAGATRFLSALRALFWAPLLVLCWVSAPVILVVWLDTLISRFLDILLAFPGLLLAIAVVAVLGNGMQNTVIAISIFSIPTVARMVRGEVLSLRGNEYISACKVMGESSARIIFTHIIPNAVSQIIVNVTLQLGTAILIASSLSFLGLGVTPPDPEWGSMLSQAREVLRSYPMQALIPGAAITLVVMSFSLIGDGLRDALDPRLKNV